MTGIPFREACWWPHGADCELNRKACRIVDLQAGFLAGLVAANGHQTRPHGGSNGGGGGGVGEPANRQGTALFNQGIDLLNQSIASKTVSGVRLELACRRR